ncbi:hypothetical protein [Agrobacterium tumefaciens]|nr:hypothetical protein [Agrobacterium tumefaciens]
MARCHNQHDGEAVVVMATKGRSDFRLRQEVLGRRSGKANSNAPIFTALDLLFFNGRDLTSMPLSSRRHLLEEFLHIKVLGIMFSEAIDADGEHYSLPSANSVSKASSQRIEAVTIAPAAWATGSRTNAPRAIASSSSARNHPQAWSEGSERFCWQQITVMRSSMPIQSEQASGSAGHQSPRHPREAEA